MRRGISVMGTKKAKRTAASTVGGLRKAAGEVTRGTVSAGETLPGGLGVFGRQVSEAGQDVVRTATREATRGAARSAELARSALETVGAGARDATRTVAAVPSTALLEQRLARQESTIRELETRLAKLGRTGRRNRSGSGVPWLVLFAGGAYVLAQRPELRQQVLDLVGRVSPSARDSLHRAGRTARDVIGTVWIERAEEETGPAARTASYGATSTTQAISSPAALREADQAR